MKLTNFFSILQQQQHSSKFPASTDLSSSTTAPSSQHKVVQNSSSNVTSASANSTAASRRPNRDSPMRPSQSPRGGGQVFHQSADHIPSATSLKHLPGYKGSSSSHHEQPPVPSAVASSGQSQQGSGPPGVASATAAAVAAAAAAGGPPGVGGLPNAPGGDGISKDLLDSISSLSKLPVPVWKPSEKGGGTPTSTAASTASSTPAVISTTPSRSTIGMKASYIYNNFS